MFVVCVAVTILAGVMVALGMKGCAQIQKMCFYIGGPGLLIMFVIMILTSHGHFMTAFNSAAHRPFGKQGNVYAQTLTVAAKGIWIGWAGTLFLSSTRVVFAAAFDRILPEKTSYVSERRHVPVWGLILMLVRSLVVSALYAYTSEFKTFVLDAVLVPAVTFFGTLIAGMILPWRKRELFESSVVGRYRIAGVPVSRSHRGSPRSS